MIAAINHLRIQIARNQPDSQESFSSVFYEKYKTIQICVLEANIKKRYRHCSKGQLESRLPAGLSLHKEVKTYCF